MISFIAKRLAQAVPVLLGVSVLVFLLIKLVPGDPVSILAGPTASDEAKQQVTESLGLDRPIFEQFVLWFANVLRGDFGLSTSKQTAAAPIVWDAFANTLILALAAALFAAVVGVLVGIVLALRPRSRVGRTLSAATTLFVSIPSYTLALLLIVFVAGTTRLFPTSGMYSTGAKGNIGDLLLHLVLPAITAGLVSACVIARTTAASLIEARGSEWAEAYRARGIGRGPVFLHCMHNSLPSLLTIGGLQVGYLLGGVIFVEAIFSWPGIGLLVYQAISARDMPLIIAGVLVTACAFIVINLIVDALHAFIDPRVREARS